MPSATAGGANLSAYFKLDGSRTITGPSLLALAAGSFASDALTIRGAAGQTGDLLVLQSSALADLVTVSASGLVTAGAGLAVTGNAAATGIVSGASGSFTGAVGAATANVSGLATLGSVSTGQIVATSIGIGVTPTTVLDIVATTATQLRLRNVVTNATTKHGTIQSGHYTSGEEDVALIAGESTSVFNLVRIGGGYNTLNTATALYFYTASTINTLTGTPRMTIDSAGRVAIGLAGGTASAKFHVVEADAVTNAATNVVMIGHNSSGTPTANFGTGLLFQGESSTTVDRDMGRVQTLWQTATDASRAADLVLTAFNVANEREGIRIRGGASGAELAFFGGTPAAKPSLGAWAGLTDAQKLDALRDALNALSLASYS